MILILEELEKFIFKKFIKINWKKAVKNLSIGSKISENKFI